MIADDGLARSFAKERGIWLTGTLGILIKAVKVGVLLLTDADAIHTLMVDEEYRSPLNRDQGISAYLSTVNDQ